MAHLAGKPSKAKAYIGMLAAAVALIILPSLAGMAGNSWIRILDFALLYTMLALGLNIVVGFAGLLDLGYIAFYAVGAYLTATLASPQMSDVIQSFLEQYPSIGNFLVSLFGEGVRDHGMHLSVWVLVPLSALFAAIFGVVLGTPTLRLRGDYLAIVTLGFGEIIRIFINNLVRPVNLTNGPYGISSIDPVTIGPINFRHDYTVFGLPMPYVQLYYYLFLVLVILIIFFTIRLQDSRIGRAWVAIREDEIAAKAMGINTRNVKLLAFAMGASFGGVSGSMFASMQGFVSPESFGLVESMSILSMVVLGGMGHVPGVIVGAILLSALPEVLRHVVPVVRQPVIDGLTVVSSVLPDNISHTLIAIAGNLLEPEVLKGLIISLAMIIIMLTRPSGLWPAREHGKGLGGIKPKLSAAEGA